ncbi:transglutaminase [Sulfuriferula plumbiphila]|uniref:Transglutaminase n=1 Tax=Sulfuriferula plumbiphila TaxID=171865 RepID=A0A512L8T3_9PROT|nr:transglutaminase family protein [Sulfuriferula plumbiphila]BBP04292.1 transglutaminase [Sulfuriferula plumbiphila]GEP30879.1 transglutaminase [Sulfuriferula plumbiphila]
MQWNTIRPFTVLNENEASMIRLEFDIALNYEVTGAQSDFIFNIHAAQTGHQSVVNEQLYLSQPITPVIYTDSTYGTRYMRLQAVPGPLTIRYDATVDISHYVESPENLVEVPISQLPSEVLPYIYPSRYCQSDRLGKLVTWEFAHAQAGYRRVQAIQDWVRQRTSFLPGSSNSTTSATDTIIDQAGVCRDFAHLMIALCRAMNIPARFVTGIDYGADPKLGPTDFHAYVEVFLSNRWYSFDPSGISPPMGLVRLGTGRDAADASFATVFGSVKSFVPVINIEAIDDPANGFTLPRHCTEAMSTHAALVQYQ